MDDATENRPGPSLCDFEWVFVPQPTKRPGGFLCVFHHAARKPAARVIRFFLPLNSCRPCINDATTSTVAGIGWKPSHSALVVAGGVEGGIICVICFTADRSFLKRGVCGAETRGENIVSRGSKKVVNARVRYRPPHGLCFVGNDS